MTEHRHEHSAVSTALTALAIGAAVTGAAVVLAPHILPAIGLGSHEMAAEAMFVLHTSTDAGGSALAGTLNKLVGAIPLAGEKLAQGGLFTALTTAGISIGGLVLGHAVEKYRRGLGKAIKYTALITSAIIALPTLLTALSAGLIFLSTLTQNVDFANSVVNVVDNTLGAASSMNHALAGVSGMAAAIPHLLTCGAALLPAIFSVTPARPASFRDAYLARLSHVNESPARA